MAAAETPLPAEVNERKEEGNALFRDGDFLKAAAAYTKAIKAAGPDASTMEALAPVYSNRSAAFVKLSKVYNSRSRISDKYEHELVPNPLLGPPSCMS